MGLLKIEKKFLQTYNENVKLRACFRVQMAGATASLKNGPFILFYDGWYHFRIKKYVSLVIK